MSRTPRWNRPGWLCLLDLAGGSAQLAFLALLLAASAGCDEPADISARASSSVSPAAVEATASPSTASQPVKIATHGTPNPAESRARRPEPLREITFDTIKLNMTKEDPFVRSLITPAIDGLNGKRVRLRGYILPSFQQTGITQFVLVRDNLQCCFGPGAALYDCIIVEMQPGKSANYTVRPVTVTGTFAIQELLDPDGKHLAIYHLSGESIE